MAQRDEDAPWLAEAAPLRAAPKKRPLLNIVIAVLALGAVAAVALLMLLGRRDGGSSQGYMEADQAPLIEADAGPYKVPPADRQGMDVQGDGEVIHEAVRGENPGAVIDMGALPCHVPLPQRRLNADHAINAGENIGKGNADLLRFAIRRAGQIHDAAHRLDHEIIACTLGIRSALAKTGDRTIDQTRIDRFEAFIIKAILFQPADLEILDQHIGMGRKPPDRRLTFRLGLGALLGC